MSEKDLNEINDLQNTENMQTDPEQENSNDLTEPKTYDSQIAEAAETAGNIYSESETKNSFDTPTQTQTQTQYQQRGFERPQSYSENNINSTVQSQFPYSQYQQNNAPKYNTYGTGYPASPHTGYYYPQQQAPVKKEKKKKTSHISTAALAIILSVSILASALLGFGGGILANRLNKTEETKNLTINKVVPQATGTTASTESGYTTAQITDMTADSVVEIVTEVVETASFYQQYITSGAGSGVIISDDGYIVTNNHVIEDARKITVTLRNGNSYDAELIGTDSEVDVALIKINADEELTVAAFGDSSTIKVGDKTVVIGNPLGQLGGTVTDGIVSALDRNVTIDGKTMNLMQTNAAINPGNSGGGMFNDKGELIGIVVAKSAGSQIEGLGFAIPINNVIDVLDDLMQYGYVRGRVSLGITMIDITTQQMAMMYGVSELGCYISSVELNSNASSAGLQSGDRILAINGKEISKAKEVSDFMDSASVGDSVQISVSRNGRTGTLSVVLAEDTPDGVQSDNNSDNAFPDNDQYNNGGSFFDDILDRFGF